LKEPRADLAGALHRVGDRQFLIRLAAFPLAGRLASPWTKPPAEATQQWRRMRSRNQFMSSALTGNLMQPL
jgi:hypothetical protein